MCNFINTYYNRKYRSHAHTGYHVSDDDDDDDDDNDDDDDDDDDDDADDDDTAHYECLYGV